MIIDVKHRHLTEDVDITSNEMLKIVIDAINGKIGIGHAMFREQLESFICEYLKKTDKYCELPKTCTKHLE